MPPRNRDLFEKIGREWHSETHREDPQAVMPNNSLEPTQVGRLSSRPLAGRAVRW